MQLIDPETTDQQLAIDTLHPFETTKSLKSHGSTPERKYLDKTASF